MSTLRLLLLAAAPALMLGACKKSGGDAASGTAASAPIAPAPAGGWVEQVAKTSDGGYRMGNPDAPVKVIEYGSRTCPHCAAFATEGFPAVKQEVATGRISYEFRDFLIHGPDLAAVLLGRCNGPQAFFPLLEQMFGDFDDVSKKWNALPPSFGASLAGKSAAQQAAMWSDQLGYTSFVGQRGIPAAKAQACLADSAATDAILKTMQDGQQRFNIDATPTFVVNGEVASNAHDWPSLKAAIDAAKG
jgi:protein-disulfide isomerase